MCKVIDDYKTAYADFQSKTQAQNVIIESLELKNGRLEDEKYKLECQLENKKTLLTLYEKDVEAARKMLEREKEKYSEWKLNYRLKWKWGICAVGMIILFLEIKQLMMFMG